MPRLAGALMVMARILLLWAAFHGAGAILDRLARRIPGSRELPRVVPGMLAFLLASFPLSLLGLLDGMLLSALILAAGIHGCVLLAGPALSALKGLRRPLPLEAVLAILLCILIPSTVFRASKPQDHSDPLITYAVQPDRWLESGRITFLEETRFSAMPLLGETLALWPAAMAFDGPSGTADAPGWLRRQMDRLSLLQVFQMSLLLASVLTASRMLRTGTGGTLLALVAVTGSGMLAGWGSLAKVDMTLAFLVTASLAPLAARVLGRGGDPGAWPFILFGAALATKLTAWLLLPVLFAMHLACSGWRPARLTGGILLMTPLPAAYAVRTLVHTGSLLYTGPLSLPRAGGMWSWTSVPALDAFSARTDPGLPANLADLSLAWDYPLVLLALGFASRALARENRGGRILVASCFAAWMLICAVTLVPASWGAKYTLMVLPLMAAAGAAWWPRGWRGLLMGLGVAGAVAASAELGPRARFIAGFTASERPLGYDTDTYLSPRDLHVWANANLPPGSRLLSLFSGERYHSRFPVICARTHPYARRLFLAGDLGEELQVLEDLGITHVCFTAGDPMGMNLLPLNYCSPPEDPEDPSRSLAILGETRPGGLLQSEGYPGPVYAIFRVRYPS
jgi:hypothetical protein